MRLIRRLAFFVLVIMLAGFRSFAPSSAQATAHPNLVMSVYDTTAIDQQPTKSRLGQFAPDNPQMNVLAEFEPDSIMDVSSDGKHVALVLGSSSDQDELAYGLIGQPMTNVPLNSGFRLLWAAFSPDGRYLSYTSGSTDPSSGQWVLGVIDVASGKKAEFGGNFNDTAASQNGFAGAADIIGWSSDDHEAYLRTFMPLSANGGFDSLYMLDLSGLNFDQSARKPLPASKLLTKQDEPLVNYTFSPDGKLMAVMVSDPNNPIAGHTGMDALPVIVSVRDVASQNEIMSVKSDAGQAFEYSIDFTPDSQKLIFVGGTFKNQPYSIKPNLYIADIASKQVIKTPLLDDDTMGLQSLMACSNTAYVVITKNDSSSGSQISTLFSLHLDAPQKHTTLLTSDFITMLACVP